MGNLKYSLMADSPARRITLLVFVSILVGNFLCDVGTLLAIWLELEPTHFFNPWLLALGVLGIFGFGIALFRRRDMDNNTAVGQMK